MPFGIQPIHIVFVFIVALLVFGPKRLPEMGRSIGKALNEFRRMTSGMTDIIHEEVKEPSIMPTTNNAPYVKKDLSTPLTSNVIQPPPISAGISGNVCIACGVPNLPDARFCNKCGAKLNEKAA